MFIESKLGNPIFFYFAFPFFAKTMLFAKFKILSIHTLSFFSCFSILFIFQIHLLKKAFCKIYIAKRPASLSSNHFYFTPIYFQNKESFIQIINTTRCISTLVLVIYCRKTRFIAMLFNKKISCI